MIIGIGIDIIEIRRIERALSLRFIERVFTPREIAYCELARRVEVVSAPEGAPQLIFHGRAAELIAKLKVVRTHVSMSHSVENAIAQVMLEAD
jgi:holo-[acyl-carrier protein] synthase